MRLILPMMWAVLCSGLACASVAFAQSPAKSITIRSSQTLSTAVQHVLTVVGAPVEKLVPPNVDPFTVVKVFCGGSFTNDYYEDTKSLNPDFQFVKSPDQRKIELPACTKVKKYTTVTAVTGDTLETLIKRNLGVGPNDIISICDDSEAQAVSGIKSPYGGRVPCNLPAIDAVKALNGGDKAGLDHLVDKQQVFFPTVSRSTTIVLRPGVTAVDAIKQINEAATKSAATTQATQLTDIHESAELHLLRPLTSSDTLIKGSICDPDSAPLSHPWPFDGATLQAVIEESLDAARQVHQTVVPAVIRVADTGVASLGGYFPVVGLEINGSEKPDQPNDLDGNTFAGDYYGIDASGAGDVSPYPDDPDGMHGTEMADLVFGGEKFRSSYPKIYDLIKLSVAKIFWKRSGSISVNDSTMYASMQYIKNHLTPSVINFSVGADDQADTRQFVDMVLQARQLNFLAIIAAGNSHENIDDDQTFPAAYAGDGSTASDWIITVGASTPDGKLADFSNYSVNRVDLLAPGCRIPFDGPSGEHLTLHGTSAATPFVSFAAALIHALGVSNMLDVKARLIASADFDSNLRNTVRYSAILNIERAVRLYHDSLRLHSEPQDREGTWVTQGGVADLCTDLPAVAANHVLSITPFIDSDGQRKLRILETARDQRMELPKVCSPRDSGISFQLLSGQVIQVGWPNLQTLVPAWHFPATGA